MNLQNIFEKLIYTLSDKKQDVFISSY